ncbi:Gfo/Idh/MocA family protein [Candidatus Latescibacterota bacterium]
METLNRRSFMKTAASGITVMQSKTVFGSSANSRINLGIIGCGKRGTHVGLSFMEHTGTRVAAIADLFPDHLEESARRINEGCLKHGYPKLNKSHILLGSQACRRLLELKEIDAVLIATPHYQHPEQLAAAIDAGKHVYLEKPVAVDVNGCRRIMWSGRKANNNLSIAVGFQIRNATPFVEMVKRIHDGALGDMIMGQTYYLAGGPTRTAPPSITPEEQRIRLWALDRVLSGDNILLQGVHVIDICNWVLGTHPVKATGTCGRKGRHDQGNNRSHFLVNYEYPGGIPLSFQSQQFNPGYGDVCERFFGTKGIAESHYTGGVFIKGEQEWDSGVMRGTPDQISAKDWEAGAFKSALEDADPNKQKAFIDSIISGRHINEANSGAISTLSAILGTTAAYKGEEMTWDEMMASDDRLDPMIDLTQFDK